MHTTNFGRWLLPAAALLLEGCAMTPHVPLPDVGSIARRSVEAAGAVVEGAARGVDAVRPDGVPNPLALLPPLFEADEILGLDLAPASARTLEALGFEVFRVQRMDHLGLEIWRIRAPAGALVSGALALLTRRDPDGQYTRNAIYRLADGPLACTGSRCYGQTLVGLADAACADAGPVGIIDTGVALGHGALLGRRIVTRRRDAAGRPSPGTDHGTAVAALLVGDPASSFPGMLPQATLYAADVFNTDPDGHSYTDVTAIVDALDWLVGRGVRIVNMSFAGPHQDLLRTAVERAAAAGVLMTAAAGNSGPHSPPLYPAAYPQVLAVTAVDRRLQPYARAVTGEQIDLAAPGVGIWTTDHAGAGRFRHGTSYAAPFAAAAAARLWSGDPGLSPATVGRRLIGGARDLGEHGWDPVFGWGLVRSRPCAPAEAPAQTSAAL